MLCACCLALANFAVWAHPGGMSGERKISRRSSRRSEIGRPSPRSFSKQAWHRFDRELRRLYLDELPGPPTATQSSRIDALIRAEWLSQKANARAQKENTYAANHAADRAEQVLENIRNRWERGLPKPAPPRQRRERTIEQHLETLRRGSDDEATAR